MFVPHCRENAELSEARRPAEQFDDALVFLRLEPVLGDQFGGDSRFVRDHAETSRAAIQVSNGAITVLIRANERLLGIRNPFGIAPRMLKLLSSCTRLDGAAAVIAQIMASISWSFSTWGSIRRAVQRAVKALRPFTPLY